MFKVGDGVIDIDPNTVDFEMGGPEMFSAHRFEFKFPNSPRNGALVDKWVESGVDSVELELSTGDVYTLTPPCTMISESSDPEEIRVRIQSGGRRRGRP